MLDRTTAEREAFEAPPAPDATYVSAPAPRRPMLLTLIVASALSPLAINIFLPSMTSIAGDLDAGTAAVGLGLSLYLGAMAILQLVAGPLSDRYGRRPVMLWGIALFLVGTLICLLARSVEIFLVGRVIQSASAAGIVLSRAIVRDLFDRDRSAAMLGYVTMGLAVAPMIGPALGGLIDTAFGWRWVFILLGGVGIVTFLLLLFDLSETNRTRGGSMAAQFSAYRALLARGPFWGYAGASAFTSAVFFAFLGSAPFIAVQVLNMTPAAYGLWFMLCSVGYIAGNFSTARLSQRLGLRKLILTGTLVSLGASLATLAFFALGQVSALTLFAPMMMVGFGNGLTIPSATAGAVSVRPDAAGAAAGLSGALQIGTGALVSVMAATVSGYPVLVGIVMSAVALIGVAFAASLERPRALG